MIYVVIGASASGINGARTLRKLEPDADIILISKDEYVYSRCILHHYISNKRNIDALNFSEKDYFKKYNIKWVRGIAVDKLKDKEHEIELSDGSRLSYDKLLIASGASSFIPPVENLRGANNVVGLRNLEDAQKIKDAAKKVKNVVVLGAGLIGIDAITGLLGYGLNISVVEMNDRILAVQLDKYAAGKYEDLFRENGVNLKLGVKAERLLVDEANNPKELLLNTGEIIPCEFVVVSAGVRANTAFLQGSNVKFDKFGLIIDERGKTNIGDVYGAGDVTGRNPIWPTAVKEGIVAASNMAGKKLLMTDFFGSKNTMNFLGLATMSLGNVSVPDESYKQEIETKDGNYKKVIHKDGIIYGAIIQGDLSYAGILTQLIRRKINISAVKKSIFEIDYSDFFNIKENLEYTF
ncbi:MULTISPECIES: NAD(P)/FAD-dependent oxidoreductase [Clostridium]|uniref:NADH-dependent phenylglyoxylate dehydrogenase subunit epsilon n=2 Tax=Clostridium TaxID=1485 RepID=A0A162J8Z0_9CLOT|nr:MULTISPECIES: FAD-dependent oxidoreductase [Clostridium]OAA92025.1 NADH-dependent phenylglyoxylate dehydrogenase subunit epsilon [Clostridium coskatii]OBR92619.1 NADH-dependent phenylglyoxylate dehydrogenase subunit epsilon [Clostridium coskatii]RMC96922.1 NAD(P)/FAD-dependent oxidoreductase [Clostridium autoethanogenum]